MSVTRFKLLAAAAVFAAANAWAVPALQIGAPATGGNCASGAYVSYGAGTAPVESDTAFTSGSTLCVAGAFGPNTVQLGVETQYSSFGSNYAALDGHGAVLMAAVSDLAAASGLTINGNSAFTTSLSALFPNNHAPLGSAAGFLYFDIGAFTNSMPVVDFADPLNGASAAGEIKALTLGGTAGLAWAHFDVMAIETDSLGKRLVGTLKNNPGSHDATWQSGGGGGGGGGGNVPEPATLALLGLGLLGVASVRRGR